MNRFSLPAVGLLSAALLAGSVAAAASGNHLECVGTTTWFICDLGANSTGETFVMSAGFVTASPTPWGTTSGR